MSNDVSTNAKVRRRKIVCAAVVTTALIAIGVGGQTVAQYAERLNENLASLPSRFQVLT